MLTMLTQTSLSSLVSHVMVNDALPIIALVAVCLVTACRVSVSARKTEMVRTPRLLVRRCPQAVTPGAP